MSLNTFCIGSEKPEAVYSILEFCEMIPQPQVSVVLDLLFANMRIITKTITVTAIIIPLIASMFGKGKSNPIQEKICFEKTPKKIQKKANIPGPINISGWTSFALLACSLRGCAKKIIPKAFTKQAAAKALVNAKRDKQINNKICKR